MELLDLRICLHFCFLEELTSSYCMSFDTRCCGGYKSDLFYPGVYGLVGIKNKTRQSLVRCWIMSDRTHTGTLGTGEKEMRAGWSRQRNDGMDRCQVGTQKSTGFKLWEAWGEAQEHCRHEAFLEWELIAASGHELIQFIWWWVRRKFGENRWRFWKNDWAVRV